MWEEGVKLLVKHGADVNTVDKRGWSPLIISAFQDCGKLVKILMKYGGDIMHRDTVRDMQFGKQAVDRTKSEEVRILLKEEERKHNIQGGEITENQTLSEFLKYMNKDSGKSISKFKTKDKKSKMDKIRCSGSIQESNIHTMFDNKTTDISFNAQASKSYLLDNIANLSPNYLNTPSNNTGNSFITSNKSINSLTSSTFYKSDKLSNLHPLALVSDSTSDLLSHKNNPVENSIIEKQHSKQFSKKSDKIQPLNLTKNTNCSVKSLYSPSIKTPSPQPKSAQDSPRSTQKLPSSQNSKASKRKSLENLKSQLSILADSHFSHKIIEVFNTSQCLATQEMTAKLSNVKQDISTHLQKSLDIMQSRILQNIQSIMKNTFKSLSTVSSSKHVKKVLQVDSIISLSVEDDGRFTEDEFEIAESHSLVCLPKSIVTKLDI